MEMMYWDVIEDHGNAMHYGKLRGAMQTTMSGPLWPFMIMSRFRGVLTETNISPTQFPIRKASGAIMAWIQEKAYG